MKKVPGPAGQKSTDPTDPYSHYCLHPIFVSVTDPHFKYANPDSIFFENAGTTLKVM